MTKAELLNYIDSQMNNGNMGVLMIRKYVQENIPDGILAGFCLNNSFVLAQAYPQISKKWETPEGRRELFEEGQALCEMSNEIVDALLENLEKEQRKGEEE